MVDALMPECQVVPGTFDDVAQTVDMKASRKAFGQKLRQLREQHGLTGQQLSEQLGLQRTVVGQYESGRSFPSVPILLKLSGVFQVSLDALLFDEYQVRDEIQDKELVAYFAKADRLQTHERALIKMFLQKMLIEQEPEGAKPSGTRKGKAA